MAVSTDRHHRADHTLLHMLQALSRASAACGTLSDAPEEAEQRARYEAIARHAEALTCLLFPDQQ